MKITVLLSTYNGEKYLQEQLDSLYAQCLPEGVAMEILVRDDGSSDGTVDILKENAAQGKLTWYTGENLKPAKSFWHLVQTAPKSEYYAFCDQDDVWNPDKLLRAINRLREENAQSQPLLYCSNVTIADADLNPVGPMRKAQGAPRTDFAYALIYSLAPGCTMVFNDPAREAFVRYNMNEQFEVIHDWLAHKIAAMLGTVIYDTTPTMLYRQHGNNVIGAHSPGLRSFLKEVKRLMTINALMRSKNAESLLNVYGAQITQQNKRLLELVSKYRESRGAKKRLLKEKSFSVRKKTDLFFRTLVRLNKI